MPEVAMKSDSVHHLAPSESLAELLRSWVRAGLITTDQAEAIRSHEAGSPTGRAALRLAPEAPAGPSLVVEALGYLGGIVMAVGGMILVGLYWPDLPVAVRLGLVGATVLALVGAGSAVSDRLGDAAGRLRTALWAAAVLASGGFFGLLATEVLDLHDDDPLTFLAPATTVVAALLWWWNRTWLNQLALFVPVVMSAVAAGVQIGGPDSQGPGVAVWIGATAWTALAWAGWIGPRLTGVAFGVLGAVFGSLTMGNDVGIALALATAVGTVALALWERSLPWLGVGAVAMLYASPRAAVAWFPGRLSAALTLIVTGGVLVGASVWVARHRAGQPPS
jgi:hypothetical protein